ncbi:MAG: GNAT family N-acetyltransferase [Defluviitaleaceae bacterium]|nr:GNAT family N-acetyltransferase [Defluviitaleaceae bacterium]
MKKSNIEPLERQKIRLILPSQEMRPQAEDFVAEFQRNGEEKINGSAGLTRYADFADWLKSMKDPDPAWIPSATYFAVTLPGGGGAGKIVGIVNIRHYLTEENYRNGHVGLSVRPSERGKGYGTEMMRLALQKAYEIGILEAVVCCDKGNAASRRVIRRNGLQKKAGSEGEIVEENGNVIWVYAKELP